MIDRKHIEKFLHLNGLRPDAPDEEIKSLLISARWHENDVETALVVLREDPQKKHQHIDSFHNVFNTNNPISPDTLHSLLGIEINLSDISKEHEDSLARAYHGQIISIVIITILLAVIFLMGMMWFLKVGIFHSEW